TINAMAIELHSGAFGLLDPLGGRAALVRRRLRVLHPLSYVEDPTRVFRAARYATRFGFAQDAATARARALALRLVPYAALSGQRLAAELERILAEARAELTLSRLGTDGAFRLLDPRYRFTAPTAHLVAELARALVALSGDEVVALGVPRGPAVARVLAELRDGRLDGRITDRAMEIAQVRHRATRGG